MREFIEIETLTRAQNGCESPIEQLICSRIDQRVVMVYARSSDGDEQRVKTAANIAARAMNLAINNLEPQKLARSVVNAYGPQIEAFSILTIEPHGKVTMIEYRTPRILVFRHGVALTITTTSDDENNVSISEFTSQFQDRIVLLSHGITSSGTNSETSSGANSETSSGTNSETSSETSSGTNSGNSHDEPRGIQTQAVQVMITDMLAQKPTISAHRLASALLSRANQNDNFSPRLDMSCGTIYIRQPRMMLICTGPPVDKQNDTMLAQRVDKWQGTKVISGGTTAGLIARELGREINVDMRRDQSGLPPTGTMEGIDLIAEGVLTLSRISTMLDEAVDSQIIGKGTDYSIARMLISHDEIHFLVGTCVNPMHMNLPVELKLRRDLVPEIAKILVDKFKKSVTIEYI